MTCPWAGFVRLSHWRTVESEKIEVAYLRVINRWIRHWTVNVCLLIHSSTHPSIHQSNSLFHPPIPPSICPSSSLLLSIHPFIIEYVTYSIQLLCMNTWTTTYVHRKVHCHSMYHPPDKYEWYLQLYCSHTSMCKLLVSETLYQWSSHFHQAHLVGCHSQQLKVKECNNELLTS